jgi:Tol biopolymer transport system component
MISRVSRAAATAFSPVLLLTAACTPGTPPRPAAIRFDIAIPDNRTLGGFALSPDGARLVYSAERGDDRTRRLFVRSLSEATAQERELAGTVGAVNPFLSPDGAQVAYFSRGGLWSTRADGRGEPRRITDAPADSAGGTWTADGRIVFAPLGVKDSCR